MKKNKEVVKQRVIKNIKLFHCRMTKGRDAMKNKRIYLNCSGISEESLSVVTVISVDVRGTCDLWAC